VLDDVERRAFLVQPAGKHPSPEIIGPLDIELDEGPGQFLVFPRRGRLAGAQADDDVLHPDRLAGLQRQVADDAVALVQQAQDRDPLGHRRHARLLGGRARHFDGHGIAFGRSLFVAPTAGERQQRGEGESGGPHASSGVQAL
jgi:hypothetical protein